MKRKKEAKKEKDKEWAIAHILFLLGFRRHTYPSINR